MRDARAHPAEVRSPELPLHERRGRPRGAVSHHPHPASRATGRSTSSGTFDDGCRRRWLRTGGRSRFSTSCASSTARRSSCPGSAPTASSRTSPSARTPPSSAAWATSSASTSTSCRRSTSSNPSSASRSPTKPPTTSSIPTIRSSTALCNPNVMLCERGIRTFGTATRNTIDLTVVQILHRLSHLPLLVDPSHSTGVSRLVHPLAVAATAIGADGLIIEVHNDSPHAGELPPSRPPSPARARKAPTPSSPPATSLKFPTLLFCKTFEDVFNAVETGMCRYGVLPVENSSADSVTAVYDQMVRHRFRIVRACRQRIEHVLPGVPGTVFGDIRDTPWPSPSAQPFSTAIPASVPPRQPTPPPRRATWPPLGGAIWPSPAPGGPNSTASPSSMTASPMPASTTPASSASQRSSKSNPTPANSPS